MSRNSEWLNGTSALVGKDAWCRTSFAPGLNCRDYASYDEHFAPSKITSTTALTGWTVTQTTGVSGTLVDTGAVLGVLGLSGTTNGEGIQAQANGVWFIPTAGKHLWFEASVSLLHADDEDWLIGFTGNSADILAADHDEMIVFRGADGSANINFQVRGDGTGDSADTTYDAADATAFRVGFHINGVTSVVPYVNGVELTAITSNISNEAMQLTIAAYNGATNPNVFGIDWIRVLATA